MGELGVSGREEEACRICMGPTSFVDRIISGSKCICTPCMSGEHGRVKQLRAYALLGRLEKRNDIQETQS